MITLALSLCFIGFYFFYSTSQRAILKPKSSLQQWVAINNPNAKILGGALLFLSFIICMISLGAGAGTFSFLVILMTVASLVVICAPLHFFNRISLLSIFTLTLVFEIYITCYAR
ncbi:MAG TPA: hypothetical protein ENH91_13505 [Leeuwenhoekiella sp.]|nr:hypothetical protein [Leeuwenhoekiella sp.]